MVRLIATAISYLLVRKDEGLAWVVRLIATAIVTCWLGRTRGGTEVGMGGTENGRGGTEVGMGGETDCYSYSYLLVRKDEGWHGGWHGW